MLHIRPVIDAETESLTLAVCLLLSSPGAQGQLQTQMALVKLSGSQKKVNRHEKEMCRKRKKEISQWL